ncbi:unnamed protein product [Phytophthora lilii]|uniref:Unnamed protein product n=1 Tax=Phytophthora lilii TaxID=2077276 RepID=A0A9W6T9E1_9STRA|nr:unnamed protein product [Phytophthora lilii]
MVQQSLCYEDIDLKPLCLQAGPEDSLVATTQCDFTITESTLRHGFPHLIKEGNCAFIATKMLGQRITMRGSVHFVWDAESCRVTRLFWKASLLSAMLDLLGSLEEVEQVFQGAKISPEGSFVPNL